jgi:hypothetical protein
MKMLQMKFYPSTLDKIEELKKIRETRNKTQAVAEAISVFYILCKAIQKGAEIFLEYPEGERERLVLP